jgi:hypothetical protein
MFAAITVAHDKFLISAVWCFGLGYENLGSQMSYCGRSAPYTNRGKDLAAA